MFLRNLLHNYSVYVRLPLYFLCFSSSIGVSVNLSFCQRNPVMCIAFISNPSNILDIFLILFHSAFYIIKNTSAAYVSSRCVTFWRQNLRCFSCCCCWFNSSDYQINQSKRNDSQLQLTLETKSGNFCPTRQTTFDRKYDF